mmetsp:Transcript_30232/g.69308  ORF Transcript_30232/g.69308 Transcript_30232/m.69308 type:complete len:189 (-) Transcript_30232:138-704(-)
MSDDDENIALSYNVGSVYEVEQCGLCKGSGKGLKKCVIDIGVDEGTINVVTSAQNVRVGSRVVVAPVGSKIRDRDGDGFIQVKRATVGGVISMGMLCDSTMLGWAGGAKGVAVQVPDSFPIGSAPPKIKPRLDGGGPSETGNAETEVGGGEGLFEKKLTKEEKKKLAAQKREARRRAKEAKETAGENA